MIDAHQHYWNPARGDYNWMPKGHPVLDRTYLPDDLAASRVQHEIAQTVLVQAAATVSETEYMLGLADATPSIAGVVGWVDFENRDDLRQLERLKAHPKFLGVRPMIQDIEDVDWMLRPDIQWAFDALIDLDLTFDALGFPVHLENFHRILTRYSKLRTVVDHCMKPRIRDQMDGKDAFTDWAGGMTRLARDTNACCKLSGLVTEARDRWSETDVRPFSDHVLETFGADRVMWGSDWPVCLLQTSYTTWRETAGRLCKSLSVENQSLVFAGTARSFYRLADTSSKDQ